MLATAAIAAAAVVVTRTRKLSRSAKNSLVCAPDEMLVRRNKTQKPF